MSYSLPILRLTTREVCDIAKISRVTLWRRIKAGQMPAAIDQGKEALFDYSAVMEALQKRRVFDCSQSGASVADVVKDRFWTLSEGRARAR